MTVSVAFSDPLAARAAERLPDDTYFPEQWHLLKIGAPQAWTQSLGFEGVTIAMIDSGVDIDHPDLKENIWRNLDEVAGNGLDDDANGYVDDVYGWDFVSNDADPRPDISGGYDVLGANHGTIDAGIAAARGGNGRGIAGVAWNSTVMPLRALDSFGNGGIAGVVQAIEYAMHNGAKIINLSFAGPANSPELAIATKRAYDAGILVVAAAGNAAGEGGAVDLDRRPLYPVCVDSDAGDNIVFGVAAVDEFDKLTPFSNYGVGCVDISAPGTRMISTQFRVAGNADFAKAYGGYYQGTSLAAAEVSGLAALMYALEPRLTPRQVMNLIFESATKIDAANPEQYGKYGRGRINAAAAVELVLARRRPVAAAPVPTASLLPAGSSGRLVVAAPGKGRATDISIFTESGLLVRSFSAFAVGFRGGASVATASFNGNGRTTIVAGALAGGSPQIRIFDVNSRLLGSFYAYDPAFRGGVTVAAADLDGDQRDEIIAGAGPGGGPHVRMFDARGVVVGGFFAFDQKSRLGVEVAAGDLDADGKAEIAAWQPGGTSLRVYSPKGELLRTVTLPAKTNGVSIVGGNLLTRFTASAYVPAMRMYGLAGDTLGDFDAEGRSLPVTGADSLAPLKRIVYGSPSGLRSQPLVTVLNDKGAVLQFLAFEPTFRGGANAAITQ